MNAKGAPSNALARRLAAVAAGSKVPFRVTFADGSAFETRGASPAFAVVFKNRGAERRAIAFGYVGLLESYIAGGVDIDGDIALAFRAGFESGYDRVPNPLLKLRNRWHGWRFSNRSIEQAKANARYHYGLGQVFPAQVACLPVVLRGSVPLKDPGAQPLSSDCQQGER